MTAATATAAATGRGVLTALAGLVDQYPDLDCAPDALPELLDALAGVLRCGRVAVRRAQKRDADPAPPEKPTPAQPPESVRPAAPTPAAGPGMLAAPASVPPAPRPVDVTTSPLPIWCPPARPAKQPLPSLRVPQRRWPRAFTVVLLALLAILVTGFVAIGATGPHWTTTTTTPRE